MLARKEQWCARCSRYVEIKIKHNKVGKAGKLVKIILSCRRCRTTLSSKTTTTTTFEKIRSQTPLEKPARKPSTKANATENK